MLTKEEFHQITRDVLPKVFIIIPPECIIVRVKDVIEILSYFTEREKPNEQQTGEQLLHRSASDTEVGQSGSSVLGN